MQKQNFRNVQLVTVTDPFYMIYLSQYKTEKKADVVYDKPVRLKSDVMGYLLELAIMGWVKNSGICLTEKIITYEYGFGKRQNKMFKELDYVLRIDKKYFVGEVKVSSTTKGNVSKACEQLSFSKELLSNIADSVTTQIIRVDLNFKNATEPFDEFNDDFLKSTFRDYELNEQKFKLLYLSARDVFNYGTKNKIIQSPEIFEPVVYETDLLHQRRQSKDELKHKKKALLEIGSTDELESIQTEITQLEKKIFLDDIKINLSQQGWVYLNDKSENDFNLILDHLGQNAKEEIQSDNFCERTNGFCTDERKTKFVSFYCTSEETEFNLLDAERVYLRLTDEQQAELQNIQLVADKESYPLLAKIPHRKFYYSNKLLRNKDSDNKSLKQFEHVVKNSQPIKVALKPNDILIFDNHRMLHKKINVGSDNLIKKTVSELQPNF